MKIVPDEFGKIAGDTENAAPKPSEDRSEDSKAEIADFGLEVQPLTPELAKPLGLPASTSGLVVTSVKEGSAAAEKGIQEGDVITKVVRDRRPQPVGSVKSFQDLASKSERACRLRPAQARSVTSWVCPRPRSDDNLSDRWRQGRRDAAPAAPSEKPPNEKRGRTGIPGPSPFSMNIQIDPSPRGRSSKFGFESGGPSWWYFEYRLTRSGNLHQILADACAGRHNCYRLAASDKIKR